MFKTRFAFFLTISIKSVIIKEQRLLFLAQSSYLQLIQKTEDGQGV